MEEKKKVKCPMCGNEMNHHADKVIYSTSEHDIEFYDETYGGILEEHYKCPNCGYSLTVINKESE